MSEVDFLKLYQSIFVVLVRLPVLLLIKNKFSLGQLPFKKKGVVFKLKKWGHLPLSKNWSCLPFSKEIEVVFHFQQNRGRRSFSKKCRSFSIFHLLGLKQCCIPKVSSIGCPEQNWGRLSFIKKLGCLLFSKILWLSSIFHLVGSK